MAEQVSLCCVLRSSRTLGEERAHSTTSLPRFFKSSLLRPVSPLVIVAPDCLELIDPDCAANTWTDGMYAMMDADYFVSCLFFIVALIFINYCENLAVDTLASPSDSH